jgi:hypothetical protein
MLPTCFGRPDRRRREKCLDCCPVAPRVEDSTLQRRISPAIWATARAIS